TGDYLDDDLAKLRAEDADVRASIARFRTLSDSLRAAVDAAWHADFASSPRNGDRAIYLAAWDACRTAVALVLDQPKQDLAQPVAACRAAIDALRAHRLADDYTVGLYDQIYGTVATARRGGKADLGGLVQLSIYLAQQVRQHEDLLSP